MRRSSVVLAVVAPLLLIATLIAPAEATGPGLADRGGRHGCQPSVRALPDLGGPFAEALTFNSRRVFVGMVTDPQGADHASFWDRRGLHQIRTGLAFDTALDVNDRGTIVGSGFDPATERDRAWVYRRGHLHWVTGLGGGVFVRRINERGAMVGEVQAGLDTRLPARWSSWRAAPEVLPLLPGDDHGVALGINDRGVAVGQSGDTAVRWDRQGRLSRLATDPARQLEIGGAWVINNRAQVAGAMSTPDPEVPLFATRWTRRGLAKIGNLPGDNVTIGLGIARNGWVVGGSERYGENGRESRKAFFWPGRGPIKALPPLSGDWATASSNAHGVDSRGTVSGFSTDATGVERATVWTCAHRLAFVPEARPADAGRTAARRAERALKPSGPVGRGGSWTSR